MRTFESFLAFHRGLGPCLTALLLSAALAGCAGKKDIELATVTGKVTQGGQPLVAAEVMFIPQANGAPSGGRTDENGRFELQFSDGRPGAVPGKHGVLISLRGPEPPPPVAGARTPSPPVKEPAEFRHEAEVKRNGDNDFTFDVPK